MTKINFHHPSKKVVVVLFMIWNYGYAKNVLDNHQTQQDITPGGDLECAKLASEEATARVGGPNACQVKPHSKPWMVKTPICGGTLISKRVVLTAAHCICKCLDFLCWEEDCSSTALNGQYVTVGEHDTENELESGDQKIKIQSAAIHNKWTGYTADAFDVALIFLEKDAKLSKDVQMASLPQNDEKCPPGNVLTLAGWGDDPYLNEEHHILWAVKQECLDINKCNRFSHLPNDGPIVCVGDKKDPRNSGFVGDSGGPLTYTDKDGKTTVFGIVSGAGNWEEELMGKSTAAFSRVSYPGIFDWIKRTMESAAANNN